MTTALTTTSPQAVEIHDPQFGEMSVQSIVDRKRKIVEVMSAVMKDGDHYGRIPGCGDKPTLYKAGAEVLATVFNLAPTFVIARTDLPGGHREYQITCTLRHIASGAILGEGVGVCSTMESKYRWRRGERKCPECGKATIIKGKADYGGGWVCFAKKGGCGAKWGDGAKEIESQESGRVENQDIADTYNTVLKIAKKRAQVDCTLTAVGASDLLTQDLEDLPAGSPEPRDPADDDIEMPRQPTGSVDSKAEEAATAIMADLRDCRSQDDVRKIIPRINALPKGTRARRAAHEAYLRAMADTDSGKGDPLKSRLASRRDADQAQDREP